MSGSFIDSGLLRARVIHVGADNYVAKINNEAKYVKKVNSEIMNALNAIVRFASIIMIPLLECERAVGCRGNPGR